MTITPAQYSKTQRRFLTTLGGLGVVALAAGTFVLSYDDLRLLALRGGAARHRAFLYPWMLDGLVVVIILAILTARRSGWYSRTVRWLLLLLLIAGAGAAGVQRAVKGYAVLPDTWVNVGVAVAPWAILMLAVWLWVAMLKQLLSRRVRGARAEDRSPAAVEAVPATVVDQSIIPGLGPGDTRRLPLASSVRELEPVREPVPAEPLPAEPPQPPLHEPEPNPWDAARIDTPQPRKRGDAAEAPETAAAPSPPEPSDPVPASWLGEPESSDLDDTQPLRSGAPRTAAEEPAPPAEEPQPLLPSTRSRLGEPEPETVPAPPPVAHEPAPEPPVNTVPAPPPVAHEPAPEPPVEAPMNDEPTEPPEDEPAHHLVARTFLPTDVRLVGGPKPPLSDTQPDGIRLPDTNPDGIPLVRRSRGVKDVADEEDDTYADERAEDPDAGEDTAGAQWEDTEAPPPWSKFRSGPMPPRG